MSPIIEQAITESIAENRTVSLDHSDVLAADLALECDGESDSEHVYWGTDEDGGEWQIRLV